MRASEQRAVLSQVRCEYQPIVELAHGKVQAYEALARGPAGSPIERPDRLFAAARERNLLAELDWRCRAVAVVGALEAGLRPPAALFVNVEPETIAAVRPTELAALFERASVELRVVLEITERALTHDPATLFAAVASARHAGFGIALDDVGADPASLALMPFLEPDVIKLDLRLVQQRTSAEIAEIVNAVAAQSERTGAVVLAEGIETDEHRLRAISMGATLGQGWLFGRPGSIGAVEVVEELPLLTFDHDTHRTPFDVVEPYGRMRLASKGLLLPMSVHLERQALRAAEPPVLLAAFQDAVHFTPATAERYRDLASHCSFVAAFASDLGPSPVEGVRGESLDPADPLRGEWVVTVVGPHFAGALVARDLGDETDDLDRRFECVVTHDRGVVVTVARALMARTGPLS